MSTKTRRHDEPEPSHIMTSDGELMKKNEAAAGQLPARKVDKRSPEYLLKSGLAGGLAGCAVRCNTTFYLRNMSD
jgi:hypothetical protein